MFILCIVISVGICIAISYYLIDGYIIFATSLNGTYMIIRGISFMAGGFPSETIVIDLIKREEDETLKALLTPAVYGYFAGWVILFVLSLIWQFKQYNEKKAEEDLEEN